uniref:NADH dehydrogenase subunit 6 n=1 Tax=Aenasius arizonensis TaxID=2058190 RepID=A0A6B9XMH1_9HYME|nr:NADH dehydrogenase subunit 6 [Aenasius arizonensis]QHR84899.1 NADH dehydrogenase subunit 6 [Aenasius arizonensis]
MLKTSLIIMMMFTLSTSMITLMLNSFISNNNIHPMIMGSLLLFFSIFTSLNLSMFFNNNWFSFISFLIIIGGMMIIFMYFTSFIMNMMTSLKMNYIKNIMIKFSMSLIVFFMMLIYMKTNSIWYNKFNETNSFHFLTNKNNNFMYMISSMYMYNKNFPSIICILYILMSMIMIVKMIMKNKYTLRKIN